MLILQKTQILLIATQTCSSKSSIQDKSQTNKIIFLHLLVWQFSSLCFKG